MADFTRHFLRTNVEVRDRKRNRFTEFLRATAAGTLFERPSVQPPYVAYLEYHPPMWNVLQSSYEDVEAELNVLRNRHLDKKILFVGGDGLSIMRINHLLKMHPDLYLDSAPMVIPIQGEAPHGVFHMLHGGWRFYFADSFDALPMRRSVQILGVQWWMSRPSRSSTPRYLL